MFLSLWLLTICLLVRANSAPSASNQSHSMALKLPRPICYPQGSYLMRVDEEGCLPALSSIEGDPSFKVWQQFGPGFGGRVWKGKGEACQISFNATHSFSIGDGTFEAISISARQILGQCRSVGWGGHVRLTDNPEGFFVSVFGVLPDY